MIWIIGAALALLSYLLGSINSSIIISKMISGTDIRQEGSGNAGTTNMLRTHGKKAALFTLLGDLLKGVLAVLLAMLFMFVINKALVPSDYAANPGMLAPSVFGVTVSDAQVFYLLPSFPYIAGLFAVIGHDFPVFFGFRGGKGIATSAAVLYMLDFRIALIVTAVALIVMLVTRYVSLGSVLSSLAYPFILFAFMAGRNEYSATYLLFSVLIAVICILRHKQNIRRLLSGTESKLGKKSDGGGSET